MVMPCVALALLDQSPSPLIRETEALGKFVEFLKFFVKNPRSADEEDVGLWILDGYGSVNGGGNR